MERSDATILGVVVVAWEHYQRTQLPVDLSDREAMIARDAFLGGARAMYGLVTTFSQLSSSRVFIARVMESRGLELGLDDKPRRRS